MSAIVMVSVDQKEELEEGQINDQRRDPEIFKTSAPLHATWGYGNEILLHGKIQDRSNSRRRKARGNGSIYPRKLEREVGQSCKVEGLRPLLLGWHSIFSDTQKSRRHADQKKMGLNSIAESSRNYRSELQSFIEKRCRLDNRPGGDEEKAQIILANIHIIWHLIEIFYLDVHSNVTGQMLGWLHQSSPEQDDDFDGDMKEGDANWWRRVGEKVLQGRIPAAVDMLMNYAALESMMEERDELIQLLESNPCMVGDNRDTADFIEDYNAWKKAVESWMRKQAEHLDGGILEKMVDIAEILLGDPHTLYSYSTNDHEFFVAHLLYQTPEIGRDDLQVVASNCYSVEYKRTYGEEGNQEEQGLLQKCIIEIIRGNLYDAIMICLQIFDSPWFIAHLVDLLHHAGCLRETLPFDDDKSIRQFCLLEYGRGLISDPSIWHLSLAYFSECGVRGRAHVRGLLESQPIPSIRVANKLMNLCRKYKIPQDLMTIIINRMGFRAMKQGRLGEAIMWFARSEEEELLLRLATRSAVQMLRRREAGDEGLYNSPISIAMPSDEKSPVGSAVVLVETVRDFSKLRASIETLVETLLQKEAKDKIQMGNKNNSQPRSDSEQRGAIVKKLAKLQAEAISSTLKLLKKGVGSNECQLLILFECARIVDYGKFHNISIVSSPKDIMTLMSHLEGLSSKPNVNAKNGKCEDDKVVGSSSI
eukprot:jgi/Bigna1/128452/aug1.6_g3160